MKWINQTIIKILSSVPDLLPLEQEMRKDRVVVNPGPRASGALPKVARPWKPLPNISKMEIKLGVHDWLLLLFGLYKRYSPSVTFWAWRNGPANRYIHYMFKRISTELKLGKKHALMRSFWLLMNSQAYLACSFNYVAKGWYKNMKWSEVKKNMNQIKSLIKNKSTSINFKRVYIDKASGGVRPLGVPTLAWRVYLHMLNNILTEMRLVTELKSQHGYIPGRGVISAWEALLNKVDKAPNIFESDYTGFFNHVNHELIFNDMVDLLKIPSRISMFFWDINQSVVKLQDVDRMFEPDRAFAPEIKAALMAMAPVKSEGVPQGAATSCSMATIALRHLEMCLDLICYADDVIYFPESSKVNPVEDLGNYPGGLLVNENKSHWTKKDGVWLRDFIQFVGFRYYPSTFTDTLMESLGYPVLLLIFLDLLFFHAPVLSLLWLILTLRYRWKRGRSRFIASTRKGATLEFNSRESFISFLNTARTLLLNSYHQSKLSGESLEAWISNNMSKWSLLSNPTKLITENYVKKAEYFHKLRQRASKLTDGDSVRDWIPHIKLTGWFMARMQANTWDITVEQDFRLRWVDKSWLDLHLARYAFEHIIPKSCISIFTASSFACDALLNYKTYRRKSLIRYNFVHLWTLKKRAWIRNVFYSDVKSPN